MNHFKWILFITGLTLITSCSSIKGYRAYKAAYGEMQSIELNRGIVQEKLSYGSHPRQYLSIYYPQEVTKNRVVFYVHGGGWDKWSPQDHLFVANFFCSRGYITVLPSYRLVPEVHFPENNRDVFQAFGVLQKQLEEEEMEVESYILGGGSAGSQLAAHLLYNRELQEEFSLSAEPFSHFFSTGGVLDFSACNNRIINRMIDNYTVTTENRYMADPMTHISPYFQGKVLIIHSLADGVVEYENAIHFLSALNNIEAVEVDRYTYPDEFHTYSLLRPFTTDQEVMGMMENWLE